MQNDKRRGLPVSTAQEKALIAISRVRNILFRRLDQVFRANGLTTGQFAVLEAIFHKGDLCVNEIKASVLGTDGNIPVVINNLCKKGLTSRRKLENDGRYSVITLTDEGRAIAAKAYEEQKDLLTELMSGMEKDELRKMTELLFRLYDTLSDGTHSD